LGEEAKSFAESENVEDTTGFENIYVYLDLTRNQQEEDKKLRNPVRDFRGKGGHDRVKIIRVQVVGYLEGKEEVLYKRDV